MDMVAIKLLFTTILLLIKLISSQNFPPYWEGKVATFDNGTSSIPIPIIMEASVNEYQTTNNSKGKEIINRYKKALANEKRVKIEKQYLPNNEEPENDTGNVYKVTFTNGLFTWMQVLDTFNHDNTASIPVQFSTSWYAIDEGDSMNHRNDRLSEAIENGTVLNISMTMEYHILTEDESVSLNKDKMVEIDEHLCYYGTDIAKLINNKCYLRLTDMVESYKTTWDPDLIDPPAINTDLNTATNDIKIADLSVWCFNNTQSQEEKLKLLENGNFRHLCSYVQSIYSDVKYVSAEDTYLYYTNIYYEMNSKPAGVGFTSNITFGTNKTFGTYDFNFTVKFSNWTVDFPSGMLDSYKDVSFKYEKFRLSIYYWNGVKPSKPERKVPAFFWIAVIIVAVTLSIVMFAVCIVLCTRFHNNPFSLDVWDYFVQREKYQLIIQDYYENKKDEKEDIAGNKVFEHYRNEYQKLMLQQNNNNDVEGKENIAFDDMVR